MKYILSLISFLFLINSYGQDNGTIKHLLDSIPQLDFQLTPNMVNSENKNGNDIIWAGKIDTIEIEKVGNKLELIFYCKHQFFNNITKEKIISRQINLKDNGDGDFILSLVSENMTIEAARNIVNKFVVRSTTYILTIGKVIGSEKKYGKKFVNTKTYSFYTFKV